ncbi:MAG: glycosyltransferase [Cyanothece sp. SIO2G6]|nr:glycosyltransferase [Cyanothece sp. SIO2G6]
MADFPVSNWPGYAADDCSPPLGLNLDEVLVIIPVLNEEVALPGVIQRLRAQGLRHIRVVDNGSRDRSAAVAQTHGATVVSEPQRGYGQACWRGLQEIPAHIQWILFCDGDGSDDLEELPQFWAIAPDADLVLANRRATAASRAKLTWAQNFGNGLAVELMTWGWGYRYSDLGPLRLVRRLALDQIQMQDRGFGWTIEMQVRAIECGLRVREIPMQYGDRQGGQSKISGTIQGVFKAGKGILGTLAKFYWRKLTRPTPPLPHSPTPPLHSPTFPLTLLAAILILIGSWIMQPHGSFDSTASFTWFCSGAILMGLGFITSWFLPRINAIWFWSVTLLSRLLLLPMASGDDVWRYLWEGYLQTQGISPYGTPPNAEVLVPLRTEWWDLMNHHDTSAIYPPVAQVGFQLLAHISLTVLAFKLAFVIADVAICWLLSRRYGYGSALLYAWNPIIIYSIAGGAHYDSWFVLPLVLAWLAADRQQWRWSAVWIGVSIGVKWMSLPLLAFLLWQQRWRKAIALLGFAAIPLLVTTPSFCLMGNCNLIPVQSNFVERGRSAELVPYLLAQVWSGSTEINWIFALPLSVTILALILWRQRLGAFAESYFVALFMLTPIIHAWYFSWLIPFSVASRNWGTRLLSLSGFVYFLLPYRQFAGLDTQWHLTGLERSLLWLPFLVGFLYSLSFSPWLSLSQHRDTEGGLPPNS